MLGHSGVVDLSRFHSHNPFTCTATVQTLVVEVCGRLGAEHKIAAD